MIISECPILKSYYEKIFFMTKSLLAMFKAQNTSLDKLFYQAHLSSIHNSEITVFPWVIFLVHF